MEKEIKLYEKVITLTNDDTNEVIRIFKLYMVGVRRYPGLSFQKILNEWLSKPIDEEEANEDTIRDYIDKHYPRILVLTEKDLKQRKDYEAWVEHFIKNRDHGD